MTAAKRWIDVDTDHYNGSPVFSFLVGVRSRDGIRIEARTNEVVVQIDNDDETNYIFMSNEEFKAYLSLLADHFLNGLEITQEDANYANAMVETLSERKD